MSTLEQIRQRPILIISILGLALLLFILTAVDRPGELFTDSHTVAKIDGEKIDYMEFQKRVEQQQEQLQQRGYTNVDVAQVQEYVLQQMVNETLMEKEYKRLGGAGAYHSALYRVRRHEIGVIHICAPDAHPAFGFAYHTGAWPEGARRLG